MMWLICCTFCLFRCTIIENHVIGAVPAVNLRVISRSKAGAGPGWEVEGLGDLSGGQHCPLGLRRGLPNGNDITRSQSGGPGGTAGWKPYST